MHETLFGDSPSDDAAAAAVVTDAPRSAPPPPRLRRPDRAQVLLRPCALDELLPPGHQVRTPWAVVE